jgi:hypothetical protein
MSAGIFGLPPRRRDLQRQPPRRYANGTKELMAA